jgi:hypothetical protein
VKNYKYDGKLIPPVFSDTKIRFDLIFFFEDVIPAYEFGGLEIYIILLKIRPFPIIYKPIM